MKLLNYAFYKLAEIGEVHSAKDLSANWCQKNSNWFSYQNYMGQDFSIDAAINCLARIRRRASERSDPIGRPALTELEQMLSDYLLLKHKVAEIAACEK